MILGVHRTRKQYLEPIQKYLYMHIYLLCRLDWHQRVSLTLHVETIILCYHNKKVNKKKIEQNIYSYSINCNSNWKCYTSSTNDMWGYDLLEMQALLCNASSTVNSK